MVVYTSTVTFTHPLSESQEPLLAKRDNVPNFGVSFRDLQRRTNGFPAGYPA
jgi:hypothetical protein